VVSTDDYLVFELMLLILCFVLSASQITSEMMQNPQVLAALQHRLDSMVGTPSGYIAR